MAQKQQSKSALEAQITSLLANREKEAIALLYRHYADALFGIIHRMLPEREVAEEVLQDVFLKVWDHADKYDPEKGKGRRIKWPTHLLCIYQTSHFYFVFV